MQFKQCPNCGNTSFYWDAHGVAGTDGVGGGMVFFRVLDGDTLAENKPPHAPLPPEKADRIVAGEISCMGCSWYGAVTELR